MSNAPMTCWSCVHYRLVRCAYVDASPVGFPKLGPDYCRHFVYEPGSDESERTDVGAGLVGAGLPALDP